MTNKNNEEKIIKIIDKHSVLINRGSHDGLSESTRFEVYVPGKEIIVDDINYGALDNVKATLEIKTLYPKMALCQSDKIVKIHTSINPLTGLVKEGVAPLSVDPTSKDDEISYMQEKIIKVGDLVRKKK